jgi:hypothetical protein
MRDANEPAIVAAIEAVGGSIQKLAERGVPDLLVGYQGNNHLFEVKNLKAKGKLTPDQDAWIEGYNGRVHIVWTEEDALRILGFATSNISETAGVWSKCPNDRCSGDDSDCQEAHNHRRGTYPRGATKGRKK